MKQINVKSLEIAFGDPRLNMTIAGRMFVRIGTYVGYLVWIAAAGTFILSALGWLRALGIFFALVLLDRLGHLGEKYVSFPEMALAYLQRLKVCIWHKDNLAFHLA